MLLFLKHHPYTAVAGNEIGLLSGFGTAGEMLSLSFSISSQERIENLTLASSDLQNRTAVIPSDEISLLIVKVSKHAGIGVYQSRAILAAELLLKDDRSSIRDGYTRRGNCGHWKHLLRRSRMYKPPAIRLNGDACTSLQARETKQAWVSIKIPHHASPGTYHGRITAHNDEGMRSIKTLELQIEVLPLKLLEPEQDLFIWYKGTLDCSWPQHFVRKEIFQAQLQDIYDHGFRSVSLNEFKPELLQQAIDIARSIGFNKNVLLTAPYPARFSQVDFRQLTPIYYVSDELDVRGQEFITDHIENWRRVKAAGQKTMASLTRQAFATRFLDDDDIGSAPDLLSYYLPSNLTYFQARSEFRELRHRQAYYYWQSHMEKPDVHRVLAGLFFWKSKADGIAPYCYQHLPKAPFSPFNDFDHWEPDIGLGHQRRSFKDHMTTYPAESGSIPTLQWKALADGIYDLRYLITFKSALDKVENCSSEKATLFAREAKMRCDTFLERISIRGIDILSETSSFPYRDINSEDYASFRKQIARDTIQLLELMDVGDSLQSQL